MKRILKNSVFISIFIFMIISTISYADEINMYKDTTKQQNPTGSIIKSPVDAKIETGDISSSDTYIDPNGYNPSNYSTLEQNTIKKVAGGFLGILTTIAVIVTVITVMIVGLKILTSAPSEKAKYKEHLLPIAVGAVMASSIISIITALAKFAESI